MKDSIVRSITDIHLPRKSFILDAFDKLKEGESLVIANDENPFILYSQLLHDRGNTFSWDYLEKGPEKWRVKISKTAKKKPGPLQ